MTYTLMGNKLTAAKVNTSSFKLVSRKQDAPSGIILGSLLKLTPSEHAKAYWEIFCNNTDLLHRKIYF
jgi:ATP-dependent exoDNAse (exonuclease V) alpha subunit